MYKLRVGNTQSKERIGYPTQKPIALLERIIEASSNEGDIVFDPFCGCATTMVAADRMERQWAGIDLSPLAVKLVNERINEDRGALWGGANVVDSHCRNAPTSATSRTTVLIAIVSTASRKASASAVIPTFPSKSWKWITSCLSLAAARITSIICNCYAAHCNQQQGQQNDGRVARGSNRLIAIFRFYLFSAICKELPQTPMLSVFPGHLEIGYSISISSTHRVMKMSCWKAS